MEGQFPPRTFPSQIEGSPGDPLSNLLLTVFLILSLRPQAGLERFPSADRRPFSFHAFAGFTVSERHQACKLSQRPTPAAPGKQKQNRKQAVLVSRALATTLCGEHGWPGAEAEAEIQTLRRVHDRLSNPVPRCLGFPVSQSLLAFVVDSQTVLRLPKAPLGPELFRAVLCAWTRNDSVPLAWKCRRRTCERVLSEGGLSPHLLYQLPCAGARATSGKSKRVGAGLQRCQQWAETEAAPKSLS